MLMYVYILVLIAFLLTIIYLMHSAWKKYYEKIILNKISENISDGYLIFTANGKITNYNKSVLNIFEILKNDIKDKTVFEIFSEKAFDAEDVKKIIDACKTIKQSQDTIRIDLKNKDNSKVYEFEIKSVVNNDIFIRYLMICKDVTATYEIIEELHNNQDILANREKFATLGQLISRNCSFIEISNICNIW